MLRCPQRNRLYIAAKTTGDPDVLASARIVRNRTNKLINSSKEDFIKDSLEINRSDPKKFWRVINNFLIKKQTDNLNISLKSSDGVQLSDDESCEFMNNFLSGFGHKLQDEFDKRSGPQVTNYTSYNIMPNNREYNVTPRDVRQALGEIITSKGSGLDALPTFILKDAFACILQHVSYLMNQSLITGIFPVKWAIACVTPIPKAGDLSNAANWRPISILPLPGKILEKICTKFLLVELEQNNILSEYQFGFRSGLSTSHAVQYFVKYIADNINTKKVTAAVYLDFSRAFDSVNYELLLLKLEDMGISNMLVRWIRGYLRNRQMCTKFNGRVSPIKTLACGVPQGSVIGPILFLCYINDIVNIATAHNVRAILYADDTVIFNASNDMSILQQKLQETLNAISVWCNNNRIKLNVSKTRSCFYGRRHNLNRSKFDLTLNTGVLHPCQQYKYLGVILDETMNLEANYNNVFKRFSYKVFQFSKIKNYLNVRTRVLVYKQTVLPFVEYISSLLFLNRKLDVDKLQKLQNKALRMCLDINDPREMSVLALHN